MSITVKDVAKKAGVATSTVSRVINDHPSISEETKRKVRKVMEELGYVPNVAARNLGKQQASSIGVILPPLNSKERSTKKQVFFKCQWLLLRRPISKPS